MVEGTVQATVLLCDYAEEVGGKLYIMGGGWTQLRAAGPVQMALAIKLAVPWASANRPLAVRTALLTEDGHAVELDDGVAVEFSAAIELGRPAGLPPGTSLDAPLAVRFAGLTLEPGGYRWEVTVEGEMLATVPFRVMT
jgi:hypothetical protein